MNTRYKVRIKPKVYVRLALISLITFSILAALAWQLVTSELFAKTDHFEFKSYSFMEPEHVKWGGKLGKYGRYARFKMSDNEYIEIPAPDDFAIDGQYCIAESYKNGVFTRYVLVQPSDCI